MNEFLKMDIFFVVATIGVLVLTVLGAWVLWRLQRILKNVEYISEQVVRESDAIRQDIAEMRSEVRRGRSRLMSLFGFLRKTAKRTKDS